MSRRRAFLDEGPGEARGVVTLSGRPERLIIVRETDPPAQAPGAEVVGRVRSLAPGLAFVDLGAGPDGVLNLKPEMGRLREGQALRVEVRAEARSGKGASLRWLGEAEGPVRVLEPAPTLRAELERLVPREVVETGPEARAAADEAEAEALETIFPLPGGGTIAVERTRALVAVDVDLGERTQAAAGAKRAMAEANRAAIATAARVLRLKGEGGLVVIDLAGRGHNGPAMLEAARAAFGPDNPGVAIGPVSRFGTLELASPRRLRPLAERLLGPDGRPTSETLAFRMLRAIEREAAAQPGSMIEARAAPAVAAVAGAYLKGLEARFGARLRLSAEVDREGERFEVAAR